MAIATEKQTDIFDKLLAIANGDVSLVEKAIWASSKNGTQQADLSDTLQYIEVNKKPLPEKKTGT
jgi:hypothetical protein